MLEWTNTFAPPCKCKECNVVKEDFLSDLEQCVLVFEKNISYYISRNAQGAFKTIIKSDKNNKSDR